MSGTLAPNWRWGFSSAWLCAAALLFIVCLDAARASAGPISTQANGRARQSILSSLFPPSHPHHPPSSGRLPPETGTDSGTEMSRKSAGPASIASDQSNPPWLTGGVFGYNPNGPDWRQHSRGGIIRAQRGHSSGGVRPAGRSFISHPEQGGQGAARPQIRIDYRPLSQKVARISSQSQMWDAEKSSSEVKLPRSDEVSRVSALWSNSPSTQRAHKKTDKLSTSNRLQSSKFFGSASQTPSRAPSVTHAMGTSALRANPRPITDSSKQLNPMTSRPKIAQSYVFKDSQASSMVRGGQQQAMPQTQEAPDAQVDNRFDSPSEELIRNDPLEEDNDMPPDRNKNVAQYEAPAVSFNLSHQPVSSTYQPPLHPTSGQRKILESSVPAPLAVSQDIHAARGSAHGHKLNRSTKTIYGVSGFKNLRPTSGRYSFNRGQFSNKYPSLSFGRMPTTTVSFPRLFTSGLKGVQPLPPESDTSMDTNPNPTRLMRNHKMISQPLEGAKPPVTEPVRPATRWLGVDVASSQTWQPKSSRINTQKNNTDEAEGNSLSTQRPKEKSSGDKHSSFTPDKYKKKHSVYTFMGFQSLRDRIRNSNWNYTTAASLTAKGSSSYLRSAAGLHLESSLTTHNKTKPAGMRARQFYRSKSFPSSTAVARPPELPAKVKGVTPADILGSASFGGVRAATQTPVTAADKKDYFPRAQGEGRGSWASDDGVQSEKNSSRGAKDEAEDFRTDEETTGFQSGRFEGGMKTFNAVLDNEGSGSGDDDDDDDDVSDVSSADSPQSQGFSEDLVELDDLRTATENVSFSSVKLSRPEE